jgi:outer membrane protein OmpA-like peptidoglycan-associated protein
LKVTLSAEYFSPDNDGSADRLTIKLEAKDDSPLESRYFEVREPQPPHMLFYRWEGTGDPPAEIVWDGKGRSGDLVQSATDYPYTFSATDARGNTSVLRQEIPVDVLVIREGDTLRVQVPTIVFASNSGGFDGLDEVTRANNEFILLRIAQVLQKFSTYKVKVEGHANPLGRTEREREQEQTQELQPLSEARAQTIVDYLVDHGIDKNRLTAYGIGGARPIVSYEDRDDWWKNRRVEFILVK